MQARPSSCMHASAQRAICLQPMRARKDVSRRMKVNRRTNHSSTVTAYTAIVLLCMSPPLVECTYMCILAVTRCASGYVACHVRMMAVNRFGILYTWGKQFVFRYATPIHVTGLVSDLNVIEFDRFRAKSECKVRTALSKAFRGQKATSTRVSR
jgi:hypothetical protein